jgi:DNA replicative helicase MCM subunit Mcm2 (Cdc46/Mcm family)
MLRKTDGKQATSYRYTVRQLESLIRLSEAMARVHADTKIRVSYVREVCRLLKASNINIMKSDLEFEENQDAINEERIIAKQDINADENDLFVSRLSNLTNRAGNGSKKEALREPVGCQLDSAVTAGYQEGQNHLRRVSENCLHGGAGHPRLQG